MCFLAINNLSIYLSNRIRISLRKRIITLECSTNHVLNLYVRYSSQACTAFTMCTLIDPFSLVEGLFLSIAQTYSTPNAAGIYATI